MKRRHETVKMLNLLKCCLLDSLNLNLGIHLSMRTWEILQSYTCHSLRGILILGVPLFN